MKKIIILMGILLLLACTPKNTIDLLSIKFGEDSAFKLLKGEKYATYPNYVSTSSKKMMVFDGLDLTGYNSKKGMKNYLIFYYKKEDKTIFYYSVSLLDTEVYKKLLEVLIARFGEADYRDYRTDADFNNDKPYSYIWEDKKSKRLFIFVMYEPDNVKLNVMINPSTAQEIPGMANAGCWNDFLYERNKKKDNNYTYKEYLEDEKSKISPALCTTHTKGN